MAELIKLSAVPEIIRGLHINPQLALLFAIALALLLIFFVVLVLFRRIKSGKKSFLQELSGRINGNDVDFDSRMLNLDLKIEVILEAITNIKDRLSGIESQINDLKELKSLSRNMGMVSSGLEALKVYEHIYRAYDSGMQIKDLAQKFRRSNGEIELILNLRRMNS
jgi:hypothetical protein